MYVREEWDQEDRVPWQWVVQVGGDDGATLTADELVRMVDAGVVSTSEARVALGLSPIPKGDDVP